MISPPVPQAKSSQSTKRLIYKDTFHLFTTSLFFQILHGSKYLSSLVQIQPYKLYADRHNQMSSFSSFQSMILIIKWQAHEPFRISPFHKSTKTNSCLISWSPVYASEFLQLCPSHNLKVQCGDKHQRFEDHKRPSWGSHKFEVGIILKRNGSVTDQISERTKNSARVQLPQLNREEISEQELAN